jgi:hypothetical protein
VGKPGFAEDSPFRELWQQTYSEAAQPESRPETTLTRPSVTAVDVSASDNAVRTLARIEGAMEWVNTDSLSVLDRAQVLALINKLYLPHPVRRGAALHALTALATSNPRLCQLILLWTVDAISHTDPAPWRRVPGASFPPGNVDSVSEPPRPPPLFPDSSQRPVISSHAPRAWPPGALDTTLAWPPRQVARRLLALVLQVLSARPRALTALLGAADS